MQDFAMTYYVLGLLHRWVPAARHTLYSSTKVDLAANKFIVWIVSISCKYAYDLDIKCCFVHRVG